MRRSPLHRPSALVPLCLLAPAWVLCASPARADNPVVQHIYTADPAPMVVGDTVYLCTSHDEDVTVDNFFTMNDWFVFSSKDMVNWTDHGSPLSYHSFSWATGKAWAPHCIQRNGKFYFYVPVSDAIGVAVADSPTGPFEDAIGRPLVSNYQYIDPTVYIDDDGQAYLYFGNPRLWYVKLNEDMISYSGQVQQIPETTASFGQRSGDADRPTLYEEGPWFYKRDGLYHMVFAMGPLPEQIGWSSSSEPLGPWTYRGVIMRSESGHAFTNHAGVIDFLGRSYFFYHTQELPGGGGFKRSVAVEEFSYNADGSFPTITKTSGGVTESAAPLNPYQRVEGETMAWGSGIEVEDCSAGGRDVSNLENNDYIKVESVDFLTGATTFEASVASAGSGGNIELRVGDVDGTLLGTCTVPVTGDWQAWQLVSCDVGDVTGVQDLFLVFKGGSGSLFNLDYWQFTPKDPIVVGTGGAGGAMGTGGDSPGGAPSMGGSVTGGAPDTGGFTGDTGGAPPSGGTSGAGGVTPETGGVPGTGGSSGTGALPATGGASGGFPTTGGLPSTGGGSGTGAAPTTGGASGGVPTTGGVPVTGGSSSTGAAPATGGVGTGGSSPATGGNAPASGGNTLDDPGEDGASDSGCACATSRGASGTLWGSSLAGVFLALTGLRRGRRRATARAGRRSTP